MRPVCIPERVRVCAALFCPAERDTVQTKEQEDDCEWTVSLQPHSEDVDSAVVVPPPPVQALTLDQPEQQPVAGSPSPDGSAQADSSTLPSSAPQVTTHTFTHTYKGLSF